MKFRCTLCEWIYDEEKEGTPFQELPDDYECPICGASLEMFEPLD